MNDMNEKCNIKNVFILMNKWNITAKQLSCATGISQGNISDWKSGKSKPQTEALLKLSHYFKVPVDFFLDNTSAFLSENFIANELDDEMLCKAIELLRNEAQKRNIL